VGLRELKERWQGKVSNQIQADIERIIDNLWNSPYLTIFFSDNDKLDSFHTAKKDGFHTNSNDTSRT
jgi:hypothetical protein